VHFYSLKNIYWFLNNSNNLDQRWRLKVKIINNQPAVSCIKAFNTFSLSAVLGAATLLGAIEASAHGYVSCVRLHKVVAAHPRAKQLRRQAIQVNMNPNPSALAALMTITKA
jgi:hypothetical protein